MKLLLKIAVAACVWGAAVMAGAATTYTDGTATFSLTLTDPSGGYDRRVDAYWVTDATGKFVQTVRKDAAARQGNLTRWATASGTWTAVDGYSGATISSWGQTNVTWDCRDTNNVIVPDGTYRFYVEFTDRDVSPGQTWWTTNGISFVKGLSGATNTYSDLQYITGMQVKYIPNITYDIAVTDITPTIAPTNGNTAVRVTVTNKTSWPESFTLALSNRTSTADIGTQTVSGLEGNGVTNLFFTWNTLGMATGAYVLRATASVVPGETITADNVLERSVRLRSPTHDLAVNGISVPGTVTVSNLVNVTVTVTNLGDAAEAFTLTLTDDTDAKPVGTNQIASLAVAAATSQIIPWNTTNATLGGHVLRAVAVPVAGETATADNTFSTISTVVPLAETNVYLVKSNFWHYNDTGTDLGTAWRQPGYTETNWLIGRGPLGFGDAPTNTALRYGDSTNKYPTYYFRTGFNATRTPTNIIMRLRRDDGAVVYHNGVEVYRVNITANPVYYTNWASGTVNAPDETAYFETSLTVTNFVAGTNVIAVEVHQVNATSSDISFDMELFGVLTPFVPVHDIAVARINAPAQIIPTTTTNISVTVTNKGNYPESFNVTLNDDTDAVLVGSSPVSNLATNGSMQLYFQYTAGTAWGSHVFRVVAMPIANESSRLDNTNSVTVLISPIMDTNVLIAKSNVWRYNDSGLDFSSAPWKQMDYYDGFWPVGRGPLGYGDAPTNTVLGWGPDTNKKYPTYYFRTPFNIDMLPTSLVMRLRRDDGAVVYHNGVEVYRVNMTNNPVYYTNYASATVGNADETTYFETNLTITNCIIGSNLFAVEVHQSDTNSSDVSFDLELLGISPATNRVHNVSVLALVPPGSALSGDRLSVSITITNGGTASENVTVYLRDTTTSQIVSSMVLSNVAVGATRTAALDWNTASVTGGAHNLQAFTVVNGVTNLAGAALGTNVFTTAIGLNAVNVSGSVGGRCAALAGDGATLLVGAGATLEVLDAANPASLVKRGEVRLPGIIEGITRSGRYGYVSAGPAGLQVIDLLWPSLPGHIQTVETAGHAYKSATNGTYLYLAAGRAGIVVLNVANPAAPTVALTIPSEGPLRAVQVAGTRLYALDQHAGLLIYDVSAAANPSLLGSFGIDAGQDLAVMGSYAFVVNGYGGLLVVNVATPAAPALAASLQLGGVGRNIALNGSTAYVAAGEAGVFTLNVATPTSPMVTATNAASGQAAAVLVQGNSLFVADGYAGVQSLNLGTPLAPLFQGVFAPGVRACDVAITNGLAFVAAGEMGLRIYAVTNPAVPILVGTFAGATNARGVALAGSIACVNDGQFGLKLVNVANPAAPVLAGSYADTNLAGIKSIAATPTRAVITDGGKLQLINISTPAAPALMSSYPVPGFALSVAMSGSRVYVAAGGAGLLIFDIGSGAFSLLGSYDTAGVASGVAVSSNTVYVADGAAGWLSVDVTTPSAPALLSSSAAQGAVSDLAVNGVLAHLAADNTVRLMDLTTPLTPVAATNFAPVVRALRMASSGDLAAAAEDDAGLSLVSYKAGDMDLDGLPDSWEQAIVNISKATNGPIRSVLDVRGGDDFDGDGLSNWAEYMAGTSPTSRSSVFAASASAEAGPTAAVVRWQSIAGKHYTLWKATSLGGGFTAVLSNIPATPPVNSFTNSVTSGTAFYMLTVE